MDIITEIESQLLKIWKDYQKTKYAKKLSQYYELMKTLKRQKLFTEVL